MYFKLTDGQIKSEDRYGNHNAVSEEEILKELSFNQVSPIITGGASESTEILAFFKAPTKMKVTSINGFLRVPNVGTGNTPTVGLYNVTQTKVVGVSGSVALGGSADDEIAVTVTEANQEIAEGDVLAVRVATPNSTVTTAIQALLNFEWHSIA